MDASKPNDRAIAAEEFVGAVRRANRAQRAAVSAHAVLLYETYRWDKGRIADKLEVDLATVERLLAADGTLRCVECSFDFHGSCLGQLMLSATGTLLPCECSCAHE